MLPEEREVPLVNLYLTTKRVEDIALRLVSLRQAFTTLLGSTLSRNHLFVAGKVLLGALVRANHMDEAKFIRTYNDFVDYLSDPSKRNDTERELAEAKIHHVNMIDVLFELVLFGMMTAQKSLMVHAGGFVEDLYALLYSFLPTAANMEPEADRYLLLLNSKQRGARLKPPRDAAKVPRERSPAQPEKSTVGTTEVSYFGHLLTATGIKPDPQKISTIKEMEPPKNRAELETVLGMVNYLAKFAPSLSNANAPLHQLLKQSSEFLWDKQHDIAFQKCERLDHERTRNNPCLLRPRQRAQTPSRRIEVWTRCSATARRKAHRLHFQISHRL
ncbi:uncharacterized protein LOC129850151 isoform X2 [Salvelinus fontinalis]|uniref:uncharacterized protein LOC129850151 isoform X2 n=1 Tax=Salvelinus fontinalis TaxID=8038 RepID=UPI002486A828|nr:uncharacterized protein LOC129850151 isoform X2 [Salvelinus fontinalis]XP_055772671.1 uncharacterized protein LOC129850151 isoform X2 [Salvelinus fontinalis]XP_055772672.1 uncharacterized protein LOC129850151 isoform X2 [Salvelinus fontinalis]